MKDEGLVERWEKDKVKVGDVQVSKQASKPWRWIWPHHPHSSLSLPLTCVGRDSCARDELLVRGPSCGVSSPCRLPMFASQLSAG